MEHLIRTDQDGTKYSLRYKKYFSATPVELETIEQLEKNYTEAFDEEPTSLRMESALRFIELLFAEICETCPKIRGRSRQLPPRTPPKRPEHWRAKWLIGLPSIWC